MTSGFDTLDWLVLGAYFAVLIGSGVWFSRRVSSARDYFLSARAMPAWAVAISVLATSLSAATFLGVPQQAYEGDMTYLAATLGTIAAAVIVAVFFIPAFYRHRVTTVYELLEVRFGPRARRAASAMFMIGRVFASGARVYIAAHALSFILFADVTPAHLLVAAAVLSIVGILYTITGGIESIIWADVVQTVVFIGAIVAAVIVLLVRIPTPTGEVFEALRTGGEGGSSKVVVLSTSLDPGKTFTIWTALTGFALLNLAALGTDQDLVQRMLTCRSALRASWSVIVSQLIAIPVVVTFSILGLLLFVFYRRPDLMPKAATTMADVPGGKEVLLRFITTEMPPGMSGLMLAGLFAVGLTSLNSALNAMSSTFVSDFYRRMRPGRDEAHYLRAGRLGVAGWGIVLGIFAALCVWWQHGRESETLLEFALGVMVFAYTGLLAVFACALFTRRGNAASVLAALAVGFVVTLALDPRVSSWWLEALGRKPFALAFPWRMVIATGIAFGVCCMGRTKGAGSAGDSRIVPDP